MTTQQIIWITCAYAVELVAVIYFTRAGPRRVFGALVGGTVAGLIFIEIMALGEAVGWWQWQFPVDSIAGFALALYVGTVVSCAPLYLVTWRIVRRFGWRGLAVTLGIVGLLGPPRDYLFVAYFPEWGAFGSGLAPVIADSAAYVLFVAAGHFVMQLVAGPATADQLARQSPASS
jgi:hypothetical protein